jgi:calcineurin-like phosphoesterase family protein
MIAGLYDCFKHWHKKGTVWLYADPHFGDTELAAGVPGRPSDEEQVKLINSKVGRKDTLIILGDIGDIEYAKKLRGYKILIAGNHDVGLTHYTEVFDEVYGGALFIGPQIVLSHEPIDIPFALNIHGHVHDRKAKQDTRHLNVCSDYIGYLPINMNQLMKSGPCAKIPTVHRITINEATERKTKRGHRRELNLLDD